MKEPKRLSRRAARTIFGVALAAVRAVLARGGKPTPAETPVPPPVREASAVCEIVAAVDDEGPRRILIVEDNSLNRQVVTMHLRRLGYRSEAVSSGLEAVKAISVKRYDLILMDCHMPDMDGFEAAREIRRLEKGARNTIIAMTANVPRGEPARCLASGMDDYLSKPIDDRALKAALQKWLAAGDAAADLSVRRQRAA